MYRFKMRARASSDTEDNLSCDPELSFEQNGRERSFNLTPVAGPSKPPQKASLLTICG